MSPEGETSGNRPRIEYLRRSYAEHPEFTASVEQYKAYLLSDIETKVKSSGLSEDLLRNATRTGIGLQLVTTFDEGKGFVNLTEFYEQHSEAGSPPPTHVLQAVDSFCLNLNMDVGLL